MSEALKQIEKKHRRICFTPFCCLKCGEKAPCDVVKLARVLDRLSKNDDCGCDDHASPDCCATMVPGDCPTCEAERVLHEVAREKP